VEARLQKAATIHAAPGESLDDALARIEGELITDALEQSDFNLTRAAEQLKLTRQSLRYRMQRLNLNFGDGVGSEPPGTAEQRDPGG
jgi:DNA-binding NtrC family response regulator